MEGRLLKRGFKWGKRWVERDVVLADRFLYYQKGDRYVQLELTRDSVCRAADVSGRDFVFVVDTGGAEVYSVWHLQAPDEEQRARWLRATNAAIAKLRAAHEAEAQASESRRMNRALAAFVTVCLGLSAALWALEL